jgi:hypothetical protein
MIVLFSVCCQSGRVETVNRLLRVTQIENQAITNERHESGKQKWHDQGMALATSRFRFINRNFSDRSLSVSFVDFDHQNCTSTSIQEYPRAPFRRGGTAGLKNDCRFLRDIHRTRDLYKPPNLFIKPRLSFAQGHHLLTSNWSRDATTGRPSWNLFNADFWKRTAAAMLAESSLRALI